MKYYVTIDFGETISFPVFQAIFDHLIALGMKLGYQDTRTIKGTIQINDPERFAEAAELAIWTASKKYLALDIKFAPQETIQYQSTFEHYAQKMMTRKKVVVSLDVETHLGDELHDSIRDDLSHMVDQAMGGYRIVSIGTVTSS